MNTSIINEFFKYNSAFTKEEVELGLKYFEEKTFKAKDHISKAGETSKYLFIAEHSITRCYYFDNHRNSIVTIFNQKVKEMIPKQKMVWGDAMGNRTYTLKDVCQSNSSFR